MDAMAGLQMSHPKPRPCFARVSSKVRRSADADEGKELLAGVAEVLAQVRVDGDAFALQLGLQHLRDQRGAASA